MKGVMTEFLGTVLEFLRTVLSFSEPSPVTHHSLWIRSRKRFKVSLSIIKLLP